MVRPETWAILARGAAILGGLLGCGCGGTEEMNGFSARDASAVVEARQTPACELRRGRLVLEVERALVREYPRSSKELITKRKQPLLLLWVSLPAGGPGAVALTPLVAPEEYRAGEAIRWFEGKRLLDQPARLLDGRLLELRLAENNRTAEPEWRRVAGQIGSGVASGGAAVGVSMPSASVMDHGLNLLQRLDRDDLILRWSISSEEVTRSLGEPALRRVARYRLATTRKTPEDPTAPSAELDLLAYWEPEPGCSWEPSGPRP